MWEVRFCVGQHRRLQTGGAALHGVLDSQGMDGWRNTISKKTLCSSSR